MKYLRSILTILLLCLICQPGLAQELSGLHQELKKDVEDKNYHTAISSLKALKDNNDKLFTLNNYDYLLARLLENTGDRAGAAVFYRSVIARNSVLSEYALWHISTLMRSSGNLPLERIYLSQLLSTAPESLLSEAAQMRLAQSYFESRDFTPAIKTLQNIKFSQNKAPLVSVLPTFVSNSTLGRLTGSDPRTRQALLLLARSYLQSGQRENARMIFNKLCNELSNPAMPDDFALASARALDEMDRNGQGAAIPDLSEPEHIKRAAIYQFNRDFVNARLHYQAVIDRFPQSSNVPDAMYQTGRGYMQLLRPEDAIPWFERLQSEFAQHPAALDALNQAASAYARLKKANEASSRYQKYIALNSDSEIAERAYLNIIELWRDEGEFTRALEWTAKTEERFRGKTTAALAIFSRAKIQMTQNNWEGALISLKELQEQSDLGGIRVAGGTNKTEVEFLHAFALERIGKIAEAVDGYLAIPDGRGEYYGWRATERLLRLGKDPASARLIDTRLSAYRVSANQLLNQKQYDVARRAAQSALRLTDDPAARNEIIDVLKRIYPMLPAYGNLPTGNLQTFGRQEILIKKERKAGDLNVHEVLSNELLFLGLYDEGTPELEVALRQKSPSLNRSLTATATTAANPLSDLPAETAYTLAVFYQRGDKAYRSTAFVEPLWKKVPEDYALEAVSDGARATLKMLYPTPYAEALLAETSMRGPDPRFVLSIMRQESRFRPDVKSNAAARGLMQFISSTADTVAGQLARKDFDQDDLYHPETSIAFGAQYLRSLFELFPDQPQAVAASYNGGEHNMARWLKRTHSSEPDLYVSEVVFSQSKDYVYKVLSNYRIYRSLYDDKLKPLN